MKIVADNNIPGLEERIRKSHPEIELVTLHQSEIDRSRIMDADALLVRTRTRCDAALLDGSKVRMVATGTIGFDHIDRKWCADKGIKTFNAPGCNAPAVMQYVAGALATAGFDPSRHTLGIVGKGNVGGLVARLYREAGVKVMVCDPLRAEAGLDDDEYLPLGRVLEEADAVTLHVPLTRLETSVYPTFHLIGTDEAASMKEGAVLINASRGPVVDDRVITGNDGKLVLIIDTWEFEEKIDRGGDSKESPNPDYIRHIIGIPEVATPHIAGYSRQGKERATRSIIEALNETFGLRISSDGLADYGFRDALPPLDAVISSYNPKADTLMLKNAPEKFEQLRNSYPLREECAARK